MQKLIREYVDRYLSTAEYCRDNGLDTDRHINEFKQGYREQYGEEAAEMLFELGHKLVAYERDCMRLAMVMLNSGVVTDELREMLGYGTININRPNINSKKAKKRTGK